MDIIVYAPIPYLEPVSLPLHGRKLEAKVPARNRGSCLITPNPKLRTLGPPPVFTLESRVPGGWA